MHQTLPDRFASLASYENGGFHLHHVDVRFRVNDGPVVLLRSFSRQFMLYIPLSAAGREATLVHRGYRDSGKRRGPPAGSSNRGSGERK